MTKAIAVIGAMYGGEGKGLMTDYFAHKYPKSIVIRSNGGVQANHTVETPEGERHVFSHFGSGSFVNTATYLSEFFVCNPTLYLKERAILHNLGVFPTLVVHPDALISTPFDMIVNMILEARRGADRHGSCGVGFGETIARSIAHKKLTMQDLLSLTREGLRDRLLDIRSTYIADRFKDQPLDRNTKSDATWMLSLQNDNIIEDWLDDAETFTSDVTISGYDALTNDVVIFEGAQGLMLDQQSPDFPHVTRSNTGVKNMMEILRQMNQEVPDFELEDFEVVYVSRAYTTRHGAGPLEFEQELPYDIPDTTNTPNINQGDLRLAPLLLDTLSSVTLHDFDQLSNSDNSVTRSNIDNDLVFDARVSMAFTCLDQIGDTGLFIAGNALTSSACEDFVGLLVESSVYTSYGPTRADILENRR